MTRQGGRQLLILTLLLWGVWGTAASSSSMPCRFGLGTLYQDDLRLKPFDLFSMSSPTVTYLCGPTCYLNGLHKLRQFLKLPQVNSVAEMVYLAHNIMPQVGVPVSDLREVGIRSFTFANMSRQHLSRLGLSSKVDLWGTHIAYGVWWKSRMSKRTDIPDEVLLEANHPDTVVILNYQYYKGRPSIHRIEPSRVNFTPEKGGSDGGHYVVLAHVRRQKTDPNKLSAVLQNPADGYMPVTLIPVRPKHYGVQTYQIKSQRKEMRHDTILLSAAIRIRVKK